MSAAPDRRPPPTAPWPGEPGAERLRDAVRAACTTGAHFPARLESFQIGGPISLIARYLNDREGNRLGELAPELSECLLAPYLGVEAARRVALVTP